MKKFIDIAKSLIVPLYIIIFLVFISPAPQTHSQTPPQIKIAELWHVDMFEGGSGSRSEFLRQRAIEYENLKKGNYILVKSMTYEQIINNLIEGNFPDMFSYGMGLGAEILSEIAAFEGNIAVYDNLLTSGVLENKVFAVPWCAGSYIIACINEHYNSGGDYAEALAASAKNNLYSFITGYSSFNNPLLAAYMADKNITFTEKSLDDREQYSQYQAYSKFITKNASVFLLGTQRDAVRISQRENACDFSFQPLKGYSDLVCYISICNKTAAAALCQEYIEYLLSEKSQKKLNDINMFSVNTDGLYDDGIMKQCQSIMQDHYILNVFISKEVIAENRVLAYQSLAGNKESAKKLRQMLPIDLCNEII